MIPAEVSTEFLRHWLSNREHILDTLLSNLDGMAYCCLLDDAWTMLYISEGCHALTGYTPDELMHYGSVTFEQLTH